MINPEENQSKGYAFVEFNNYKEFQSALNNPEPVIFGKQKLVFNSAKNRYDTIQNLQNNISEKEEIDRNNIKIYEYINNDCKNNIFAHNKDNIQNKISGISDGSTNNSSTNSSYNSALQGEKNKNKTIDKERKNRISLFDDKIKDQPIDIQIKYALKNMAISYGKTNPYFMSSKLCNFYCGPFLDKDIDSKKESFFNASSKEI